jgi:flagellar P-ring protein FlgI
MRLVRSAVLVALVLFAATAMAARIKDITTVAGIRDNQLVGYGLVVGLTGTGDKVSQAPFTQQSFVNMLLQFGIRLPNNINMELKNVAAVAIHAKLPPFAKIGQRIDVTVASIGNSTSLRGGSLLMAPLKGADGKVYAMAQGSIIVSGFGAQGSDGSKVTVNVPSAGDIPNGATVEDTIFMPFVQNGQITFELSEPDFTTAELIEKAINSTLGRSAARALDAGSVAVRVAYSQPAGYKDELPSSESYEPRALSKFVPLISRIQNIILEPAHGAAKVVVNSRTGTIVVGEDVTISPVAVAHGNLAVIVTERAYVSQPTGFSNGRTVQGKASDINVDQKSNRAFVFSPGPSLGDLVEAINRVGAAPGDVIAILQAIKSAGALHADLEVI